MNKFLLCVVVFVCMHTFAFAQSTSGYKTRPGWTADHELQWQHHNAMYQQNLQKKARQEQRQGIFGIFSRELQDRQSVKFNNGMRTGHYK